MMVFLHLFNGSHTDECINLLYIGEVPFAKWLSNACGPVPFFLLLSGYGLAYTCNHAELTFTKQLKRIFKLYIHYWIILLFFLLIGWYLYPGRYPGSWSRLIVNIIGWKTDYNYEMWFLFPYSLVALSSKHIIKTIEKNGFLKSIIVFAAINFCACYVISKFHSTILKEYPLMSLGTVYLQFLYPFAVGVVFYKSELNSDFKMPKWCVALSTILLISIAATINISVVNIVYVPIMVFLFCQWSSPLWLEKTLIELGKKSMPIWMIHTWLSNYLFHEQVYSLKYPIFILGGGNCYELLTLNPSHVACKKCFATLKV